MRVLVFAVMLWDFARALWAIHIHGLTLLRFPQVGLLVVSRLAREEVRSARAWPLLRLGAAVVTQPLCASQKGTSHPAHEVSRGLARDLMGHWALGDEGCDDGVVWVLEARPEGLPRPAMTSVAGEGAAAHLLERELAGISDAFDQDLQASAWVHGCGV